MLTICHAGPSPGPSRSINSLNVYLLTSEVGTPLQHTSGLASVVLSTSDGSAPKTHDRKVGVRCKFWSSGSNIHEINQSTLP